MQFNRETAKRWMKVNKKHFVDPLTHELNHTALAEACASNFNVDEFGGILEDNSHWIWDIALEADC